MKLLKLSQKHPYMMHEGSYFSNEFLKPHKEYNDSLWEGID